MHNTRAAPVEHPGTFIAEELDARNWHQVDLAYILGMSPPQLNDLIAGRARISPDMAVALGDAFDMPPEFFANLQKLYDLQNAKPVDPGIRTRAAWLAVFPIREMIKRGWIEDSEPDLLDLQMTRFFCKSRVEDIPFIGNGEVVPHAPRKSSSYEGTTPVQYAWLHRVMKIAGTMDAPEYSPDALRNSIGRIRSHLIDKDDLGRVPEILWDCGVRLVIVEALPGAKIDGVCVWPHGQPAVGLSLRLDRLDNFAFVLRHELEHVLQCHGRENSFTPVDEIGSDYDTDKEKPEEEKIADAAAAEFCVPQRQLESFVLRKSPFISEQDVLAFSRRVETNAAIVIGQIQRRTKKYNWLRKYLTGIRPFLSEWKYIDGWNHRYPTGL